MLALERALRESLRELDASGGSRDVKSTARTLNISERRVRQLLSEKKLFSVPGPDGKRFIPCILITRGGKKGYVEGLDRVQDALEDDHPWMVLNFLVNPHERLANRRPIDVLADGRIDDVIVAAEMHFEGGA